jgi:hypothetical protein
MSCTQPSAADEPRGATPEECEEASILDHLNDAWAYMADAQWSLNQVIVLSERDEFDLKEMNTQLKKMYDTLAKILRGRGVL